MREDWRGNDSPLSLPYPPGLTEEMGGDRIQNLSRSAFPKNSAQVWAGPAFRFGDAAWAVCSDGKGVGSREDMKG